MKTSRLTKLNSEKTSYEPYKYVLQDTGSLYIGAKFTFAEMLEDELISFKMKAIISHYLLKECDKDDSLESILYYLSKGSFTYETLFQLKVSVKVQELTVSKGFFGKTKSIYKEKIYKLEDFADINLAKKKGAGIVITEMIVSKLSLMSFSV